MTLKEKNLKRIFENNKYLKLHKYYRGLRWSEIIIGVTSKCVICKKSNSTHVLSHNRKTDHNGDVELPMCYDCGKIIDNEIKKRINVFS